MLVQTFGPTPVVTTTGQIIAAGDPPATVDPTDPEVARALADDRLIPAAPEPPAKPAKDR